ncbi:MAG: transcriptional repressor [Bacteroidaceae bacterium]|nr:transcriptional repressor [Bacteroidaceae bacterium]
MPKSAEKESFTYQQAEQKLLAYIEQHAMRKTPERFEVLRMVCSIHSIFSVDELVSHMQKRSKFVVSRATIFNTLDLFYDAGLVVKHTLKRAALYEYNDQNISSMLMVCAKCGAVQEYRDDELTLSMMRIKAKQFTVQRPVLYLHGLCSKCVKPQGRKKNTSRITKK